MYEVSTSVGYIWWHAIIWNCCHYLFLTRKYCERQESCWLYLTLYIQKSRKKSFISPNDSLNKSLYKNKRNDIVKTCHYIWQANFIVSEDNEYLQMPAKNSIFSLLKLNAKVDGLGYLTFKTNKKNAKKSCCLEWIHS